MAIKLISKIRGSLTAKMFTFVTSVLIAICALMYALIIVFMPFTYKSVMFSDMADELLAVKTDINEGNLSEEELGEIASQYSWDYHVKGSVEGSGEFGHAKSDSSEDLPGMSVTVTEAEDAGTGSKEALISRSVIRAEDSNTISVSETVFNKDGEILVITASQSLDPVDQATGVLIEILPFIIVGILTFSVGAAFFVSRYMTRPIRKISGTACQMAEFDLAVRCETGRTDEIGILSESLNGMAMNLDTAMGELREANEQLQRDIELERTREQQRRDFFSAVSHELKTPITILKGELEGMIYNVGIYKDKEKYLRHSLKTTESMENLVREILSISKMEGGSFELRREEICLSELVSEVMEKYQVLADERGLELKVELDASAACVGDGRLLEKAVSNIVGNAVAYSPGDETVFVELGLEGDRAVLSVENTGANISEEDMLQLFEPFYRVDKSRNRHSGGSGLGLYIVKIILSLHGFDYRMENTERGVIFKILFDGESDGTEEIESTGFEQ